MNKITLTDEHIAAAERQRRIVVNFDVSCATNTCSQNYDDFDAFAESLFTFTDADGSQIDSLWWSWSEGNQVPYKSEFLPLFDDPLYRQWVADGIDIVGIILQATHKRGKESFYVHRINSLDNDLGPFAVIPMKVEHPEWQFRVPWSTHEHNCCWNFTLTEVHDYVLRNLKEVAERWSFDGIEIDFARGTVFPPNQGWVNRDRLTTFMHRLRQCLQEIAAARGRPFLLAARVPDSIMGCHFDGLDVETWVREQLVDMFTIGVRTLDSDVFAFRRLTSGTHIKLYPAVDEHHASDGYKQPGIELFRGTAANWYAQGADGVQAFNFTYAPGQPFVGEVWQSHRQFYLECGSPETLAGRDRTFIVERRGGGHGPSVVPNADDWSTPRYYYNNSNMLATLPAPIDNDGRTDTLLVLNVADPLEPGQLEALELRLLLSDPAAAELPDDQRLTTVTIATIGHAGKGLLSIPPATGIESHIEMRINNILLASPIEENGWLVYRQIPPAVFAAGENLIGVCAAARTTEQEAMQIEKLELHVRYRAE